MRPKISYPPSASHRSILDRCPRLSSDYARPFLLFNGHVETIWASKLRTSLNLDLDRELMEMPDGGVVAIDTPKTVILSSRVIYGHVSRCLCGMCDQDEPLPPDRPVLILLPGLAGGSQCTYVQYAMQSAR